MIHAATKCARAAAAAAATIRGRAIPVRSSLVRYTTPLRSIHGEISVPNANNVAIQMVFFFFLSTYHHRNFKFSLKPYGSDKIRKKIEQCLGNHADDDEVSQDSKATVLLAMSDLLYERLLLLSLEVYFCCAVVALEALVGLLIQSGQDDTSLNVADKFLELVKERGHENLQDVAVTAKTIKGLAELL
ncbi:unnamed protein product [Brassica oleracea]